jgi:hypothetical protein
MTTALALALGLAAAPPPASPPRHFEVAAAFAPPSKIGGDAAVSVLFSPTDPDVRINEEPAPRLKLEPGQSVLVDRQRPSKARSNESDLDKTRYLDLAKPLRFPVALAAEAPKGPQELKANVVYFYCSKREGWCRRGNAEVRFTVDVP